MNNKTLLYLSIAAVAYYLINKKKKNEEAAYNLQKMTDQLLASFILDLQKNPEKYVNAKNNLDLALKEQTRRSAAFSIISK